MCIMVIFNTTTYTMYIFKCAILHTQTSPLGGLVPVIIVLLECFIFKSPDTDRVPEHVCFLICQKAIEKYKVIKSNSVASHMTITQLGSLESTL